jgi:signal transduction histidine kinase
MEWKMDLPANPDMDSIVLRESVRARVAVAPVSVLITFLAIFIFIPFLINQNVGSKQIVLWAVPIMLLVMVRAVYSRRVLGELDAIGNVQLRRADRLLRFSSVVNQGVMGLGIWIVQSPSPDSIAVPLFMTLIVVTWCVGVLANLFSDYRSFIFSIPLMMIENAAFWFSRGDVGINIGVAIVLSTMLMLPLARRCAAIFRHSVLMRYEKDQLLEKVEAERRNTQQALSEVQAANESKAFFLAATSHDIKQPLSALGLLTDTLLMSDLPQSLVPILRSQRESISMMSRHFDALLDIGKFEGGQFDLNLARFRLRALADRVHAEIAPLCAEKGLAWELDVDDAWLSTDQELLLRVLRNLLINAVCYTDTGRVHCSAKVQGRFIEFIILDTGCGIAPEDQQVIFKQFVRLRHDKFPSTGAGLGLSIVDKISQALNLGLQLSSTPGLGTRFTFQVPIAIEH